MTLLNNRHRLPLAPRATALLATALFTTALIPSLGCRHLQESPAPAANDALAGIADDEATSANKQPPAKETSGKKAPASEKSSQRATPASAASPSQAASGSGAANDSSPADKTAGRASAPAASESAKPPLANEKQPTIDDTMRAALAKDGWALRVPMPGVKEDVSGFRYRNAALDEMLRTPPADRPSLAELIESKNPIVAANAAIIQVRWRQAEPVERLLATVRHGELRMPMRMAAIEALTAIDSPRSRAAIETLVKQYGDASGPAAERYQPRLHGELLTSLARDRDAAAVPYLTASLKSPDAEVRWITLQLLAECRAPLPPSAAGLRDDTDPRIRAAALAALAKHRDPKALGYLRHALDDYDLSVRLAAIESLGDLGTPDARAALEKMMHAQGEVLRAAAVASLGSLGADEIVLGAAADKSSRVRQAVANTLATANGIVARQPRAAARVITTLISDRTPDVQRAAVAAVTEWPLDTAGPILLVAMHEHGYLVRKTAGAQLARRWTPAADFPADGSAEQRVVALAALHDKWIEQFGAMAAGIEPLAPVEPPDVTLARLESQWRAIEQRKNFETALHADSRARDPLSGVASSDMTGLDTSPAASPPAIDQARSLLAALEAPSLTKRDADAAIDGLKQLGPAVLPAVARFVAEESRPLPEAVYIEVLPEVAPVFASLVDLRSAKPTERRSAADKIATLVVERPLSGVALARLAEVLTHESDPLVWRTLLTALVHDPREPATRMAAMAIGHDSPEVRRRAAEYFVEHGSPRHVALLTPLLEDSQVTVVLVAVRALAGCGPLEDPAPLVALLARGEAPLRIETALALAKLGAPEGRSALERMAKDVDGDVRRGAARAMGTLDDASYCPCLGELLDDRNDVAEAAMTSLAKIVGRDVASEGSESAPSSASERIRRWRSWLAKKQDSAGNER